jgi:hypothetical protein
MFDPERIATGFAPSQARHEDARHAPHQAQTGFQFPRWIWGTMLSAYGVFFMAMFATFRGSREALFMIVISTLYAAMFFGTATLLARVKGGEAPSPLERKGGELQCWTGPLSLGAVAAQVLTVPICLAFFAVAIAVIRVAVGA